MMTRSEEARLLFFVCLVVRYVFFFFSSRRRHTRLTCDWSSDVCSSDLNVSGAIGGGAWWASLAAEYGLTTLTATANITAPPLTADVTDHDVFDIITNAVAQNGGPARDGNTLYLLYLPAGVHVIEQGQVNTDCHLFAAYHARYGTRGDQLAVVQQCSTTDAFDNMTAAASHEIAEAATDADGAGY